MADLGMQLVYFGSQLLKKEDNWKYCIGCTLNRTGLGFDLSSILFRFKFATFNKVIATNV